MENTKSLAERWSDRIGGAFVLIAILAFMLIATAVEENVLHPPAQYGGQLQFIGAGAIVAALAFGTFAIKLAMFVARLVVYAIMAMVVFADCALIYAIARIALFGLPTTPSIQPAMRDFAILAVLLVFALNLVVAVAFLPLMRTAGVNPEDF